MAVVCRLSMLFWLQFVSFGRVESSGCRISSIQMQLSEEVYRSFACGECLYYIFFAGHDTAHSRLYRFERCVGGLLVCQVDDLLDCTCSNAAKVYNLAPFALDENFTDVSALRMKPPLGADFVAQTAACCESARQCCEGVLRPSDDTPARAHNRCPATWDGWQCFASAARGSTVRGHCPRYSFGAHSGRVLSVASECASVALKPFASCARYSAGYSEKLCLNTSEWYRPPHTNAEWTNYLRCAGFVHEQYVKLIIGVASFAVSVVVTIPAVVILYAYRLLRQQHAFTIHRHLLLSFLLGGVFFIFTRLFFVPTGAPGERMVLGNHMVCRLLFLAQLRYLRLANYAWMLCEGWYLYRLLAATFAEPKSLLPYYVLGWGCPFLPTILYAVLRLSNDNESCWISASAVAWIEWIYMAPCLVALCTNLCLMVIILLILISKLRHNPEMEPAQYRKAVRATLMLLPIFGVHFVLTIYRLPLYAYEILNLLLDGLQGSFVAIIICYTNGRVMEQLKKSWHVRTMNRQLHRESQMQFKNFQQTAVTRQITTNEKNSAESEVFV